MKATHEVPLFAAYVLVSERTPVYLLIRIISSFSLMIINTRPRQNIAAKEARKPDEQTKRTVHHRDINNQTSSLSFSRFCRFDTAGWYRQENEKTREQENEDLCLCGALYVLRVFAFLRRSWTRHAGQDTHFVCTGDSYLYHHLDFVIFLIIWVFPKIVVPQNGWFTMENPIKVDDLGGPPLFLETRSVLFAVSFLKCAGGCR